MMMSVVLNAESVHQVLVVGVVRKVRRPYFFINHGINS